MTGAGWYRSDWMGRFRGRAGCAARTRFSGMIRRVGTRAIPSTDVPPRSNRREWRGANPRAGCRNASSRGPSRPGAGSQPYRSAGCPGPGRPCRRRTRPAGPDNPGRLCWRRQSPVGGSADRGRGPSRRLTGPAAPAK